MLQRQLGRFLAGSELDPTQHSLNSAKTKSRVASHLPYALAVICSVALVANVACTLARVLKQIIMGEKVAFSTHSMI